MLIDFLMGIISGLISSFLIVSYIYNENERKRLNQFIDVLFKEIDFNRGKLPKYFTYFSEVRNQWQQNNTLKWINHNEVSIGFGQFFYNYFKFDVYNLYTINGMNLYFDSGLDYHLKHFYYGCMAFCANTQAIENQLRKFSGASAGTDILLGFEEIEKEFNNVTSLFENYPFFSIANNEKSQINWIDWHLKRNRMVVMDQKVTWTSRLKHFLFPYGMESVGCWILACGSLGVMGGGGYLLIHGIQFIVVPEIFSFWNAVAFFLLSIGFAGLMFSMNWHNSVGAKKNMQTIMKKLEEIKGKNQNSKEE
jgi:hypothetical protein